MKVHLMYPDRDFEFVFDKENKLTAHETILIQDLELDTLFDAMAGGDKLVLEVVKKAVFESLKNRDEILYRQKILADCIKNPGVVRALYDIANEAIKKKRENWWGIAGIFLSSTLSSSISLLQMFAETLKKFRAVVDDNASRFESEGFTTLFTMIQQELDDEFFSTVETHLNELKFRDGILISSELGEYNQGINYVLRRQQNKKRQWWKWQFAPSMHINPRDEGGCNDLTKRKDRAINLITNALAQSSDHVLSFFVMLQTELAFYMGCLNLYDRLYEKREPVCFPVPFDCGERRYSVLGLYDVSLALILKNKVVGNDVKADNKSLVIITGANQGGKSTFLRSAGQAQLMMQCGMFVPAEAFSADICNGIFTHYKKEEDSDMKSGKLDEELGRMNDIADLIRPNSMILFNESFSATNEREGSEIGRQIVRALLERKIKVFFVSHLYDFSHGFFEQKTDDAFFLRAERQPDGHRTFRLIEGESLQTSFGEDIYFKIFKSNAHTVLKGPDKANAQ